MKVQGSEVVRALELPSLHLNGDSKDGLLEPLCDAYTAITNAIRALAQTAPHMRNWYVRPDATKAYERARAEHYARMEKLQAVRDELQALAEKIDQGGYKVPR